MRLAVIFNQPCWYDGKTYTATHVFWSIILSFSDHFKKVIIFAPLKESQTEKGQFPLQLNSRVRIVGLPFYESISELYSRGYLLVPKSTTILNRHMNSWDIAWIVDPFLHNLPFYLLSRSRRKKMFLYIRINPLAFAYQYHNPLLKIFGHMFAKVMELSFIMMMRKTLTFAIGSELFNIYNIKGKFVHLFHANLISEKHIVRPERLLESNSYDDEIKLLSVGRIVAQKGIKYLVEAVEDLVRNKRINVKCYMVGEGKDEPLIKKLIVQKNLQDQFEFLGFVPWGEQLLDLYDKSDVFVLPSLSEGVPKTLFEALSMGAAVVTTDVGGIGSIIEDHKNGLLIQPGSSSQLSDAIHELFTDKDLRLHLVKNGIETAKEFTLRRQQEKMVTAIKKHFNINTLQ